MDQDGRTVLITGASSGIGLETALLFLQHGWNVAATMRCPDERHTPLHDQGAADLVHLDVTDSASIHAAVRHVLGKYGRIDVLVNNAGYALFGPFETITQTQIARQFNTNLFGLMEVIREVLPLFRQQKRGVVVNVASMGGRIGFPLYTIYNSTKWAVEGFTESLQYELRPLNIRVKLIEPGVIKTDFYGRSMEPVGCGELEKEYGDIVRRGERGATGASNMRGAEPKVVAECIYRAATDGSSRLRYIVGSDARMVSALRRLLPHRPFCRVLENAVLD